MGAIRLIVTSLLLAGQVLTSASDLERRQGPATKYCDASNTCYSEFVAAAPNITFRIAIPDADEAPFDVLLRITAPVAVGWAGIAWGGSMTRNPLTVGWANGNGAVVSSRWATGHSLPQAYTGASYTVLPSSVKEGALWKLDVLCSGCSQWTGGSLNPNTASNVAWAMSTRSVANPASNTSTFPAHTDKGIFSQDFSIARVPAAQFSALIRSLGTAAPDSPLSTTASSSSLSSVVGTSTSTTSPSVGISVTFITPTPRTTSKSASSTPTPIYTNSSTTSSKPVLTSVITLPKPSATSTSSPSVITVISTLPKPSSTASAQSTKTTPVMDSPIPKTSSTASATFSSRSSSVTKTSIITWIPDSPWTTTTTSVKPPTSLPPTLITVTVTVSATPTVTGAPCRGPPWICGGQGGPPWGGGGGPPWRRPP